MMKKKRMDNKYIYIGVAIIIVICIIIGIIYYNYNNSNFIDKKYESKEYIYTAAQYENEVEDDEYFEIPAINLKGEKFETINTAIINNFSSVSEMTEFDYDYEYSISKNILALKITYAYYENINSVEPTRYFETFNIDLRNGRILTDSEILDKYKLTDEQVNRYLESKFTNYYDRLVSGKFYTKEECNYECFLENRGITGKYTDNASYYIQDGVLTLFKYFKINSKYEEEQYFGNEDFQFVIKK